MTELQLLWKFIGFLVLGRVNINTEKQYLIAINKLTTQTGAVVRHDIKSITENDLLKLFEKMPKETARISALRIRKYFRYYYTLAKIDQNKNPFTNIKMPRAAHSTHKVILSIKQLETIFITQKEKARCGDPMEIQILLLIQLIYRFAVMPAELLNIKIEDINFGQGHIRVGIYAVTRRNLPLNQTDVLLLSKWMQLRPASASHPYLFTVQANKMTTPFLLNAIKKCHPQATPTKIANTMRYLFAITGKPKHRIHIAAKAFGRTDTRELRIFYYLASQSKRKEV